MVLRPGQIAEEIAAWESAHPAPPPRLPRTYAEFDAHMRQFVAGNKTKPMFLQKMLAKQEANRYQRVFVVKEDVS
jgi:hypothetical protein